MELFKQEMELFLLLIGLQSKIFFYKFYFLSFKDSDNSFQNRKWNYLNRKWNYFSYLQASNPKSYLTKFFFPVIQGLRYQFPKQEMELFPLLLSLQPKDFFYKDQSLPFKDSDTSFEKRKWNYLNKEMELFLLLLSLQSKNFFNKGQSLPFNDSDTSFEKRKSNYLNWKWYYFSYKILTGYKV